MTPKHFAYTLLQFDDDDYSKWAGVHPHQNGQLLDEGGGEGLVSYSF